LIFKNREIKIIKSYASSAIRTRNPWVLRLRNTCAIGCAKKTAENVFKLETVLKYRDLNVEKKMWRVCFNQSAHSGLWTKSVSKRAMVVNKEIAIRSALSIAPSHSHP